MARNSNKKEEKIIENPIANTDEHKLKVEIDFDDKYTGENYSIGHILENLTEERYSELLNDPRKLVSKV